jgi:transposase
MTLDEALQVIEQLRAENDALRRQLQSAQERIAQLEQAAARQAAPFRRPEQKKIPPEQHQRPGRKPGHPGAMRARPKTIDEEAEAPLPPCCGQCGGHLGNRQPLVQYIEEIPPVRPQVTRLTTWQATCTKCGQVHTTSHPLQTSRAQGAAGVHLGPRAAALATLLNKHLGLTCGKTCQVLRKGFGLSLTRGGLSQLLTRVAAKAESQYESLIDKLRGSPAVFADETSWWVGGPGWWLWVFTSPQTTVYRVADCRGSRVVQETLGDDFAGMLVSDCLASYDPPPYRKHKCIAHHLRALKDQEVSLEQRGIRSTYLTMWKLHLRDVIETWRQRPTLSAEVYEAKVARLRQGVDNLLEHSPDQPEEVRFRDRLRRRREHLLGCLDEAAAEPTNNRAERALRPAVIARKLSCGNKTDRGRRAFEVLASLAATADQQARDFLADLTNLLPLAPQAG